MTMRKGIQLIIWVGIIAAWEILVQTNVISNIFFASPSEIITILGSQSFWGLLALDLGSTLSKIFVSSLFGYVAVYLVIYIGLTNKYLFTLLAQISSIIKYFPIPALIPFGILFFGINDSAQIFIITFSVFFVYFNHVITTILKEETNYKALQKSWKINANERFWNFVFPITNFLNYRVLGNIIVWVISTSIIAEMILGGTYGLGSRLLQFQQLYQISELFGYLAVIIACGKIAEILFTWIFARLEVDTKKIVALAIILTAILASLWYQFRPTGSGDEGNVILTYNAGINLPVYVMVEKFNSLDFTIQNVSSGVQVMDGVQSGRNAIGGYVDIPNALSGINKNDDLKILTQVVESKDQPSLFIISSSGATSDDFAPLNDSTIGYFPNNPLISSGFEFTALTKGARPQSIQLQGTNDPSTLVQGFISGTLDSVITPEPFVSQIEEQSDSVRINPDNSLIQGINFENLPLAGLVINEEQFSDDEIETLEQDINEAIEFIRENTTSNKPTGELIDILDEYNLSRDMSISKFQTNAEINFEDTKQMITFINLIDSSSSIESDKNKEDFYKE